MTFHTLPHFYKDILDLLVEQNLAQYKQDGIFRQYFVPDSNHKIIKNFHYNKELQSYVCSWKDHWCFDDIIYWNTDKTTTILNFCIYLRILGVVDSEYYWKNKNTDKYIEVSLVKNNKIVFIQNKDDSIAYCDNDFFNKFQSFVNKCYELKI